MFKYESRAFKNGVLVHVKERTINSDTLLCFAGKANREAFLELVNRWNKQGQQVNLNDMRYVYIAL